MLCVYHSNNHSYSPNCYPLLSSKVELKNEIFWQFVCVVCYLMLWLTKLWVEILRSNIWNKIIVKVFSLLMLYLCSSTINVWNLWSMDFVRSRFLQKPYLNCGIFISFMKYLLYNFNKISTYINPYIHNTENLPRNNSQSFPPLPYLQTHW